MRTRQINLWITDVNVTYNLICCKLIVALAIVKIKKILRSYFKFSIFIITIELLSKNYWHISVFFMLVLCMSEESISKNLLKRNILLKNIIWKFIVILITKNSEIYLVLASFWFSYQTYKKWSIRFYCLIKELKYLLILNFLN